MKRKTNQKPLSHKSLEVFDIAVGRTQMKVATLASERMFYVLRESLAPIKKTAKSFELSGFSN
ncbi:hypothetical protein GY31_22215 [Lysinibacillus sphaericus]|nr:hypothetical protein GY31_22215 [Lysinibacillus sphaericus]